jgi:transposase-like protein
MSKPKLDSATCEHDYVNFVRKGRARYHCPKCDADITLECVMLAESLMEETENEKDPKEELDKFLKVFPK